MCSMSFNIDNSAKFTDFKSNQGKPQVLNKIEMYFCYPSKYSVSVNDSNNAGAYNTGQKLNTGTPVPFESKTGTY